MCSRLNVDGLRGDLVINRAVKALVALEGRDRVVAADVGRVITSCLNHRLRKDPLDPIDSGTKVQLLFRRLTDPEFVKREEEAKRKQAEAAKGAAQKNKKAGELVNQCSSKLPASAKRVVREKQYCFLGCMQPGIVSLAFVCGCG